ncbi:MAG: hypothetical protein ACR2HS_01460, partial [Gammaproteobacteria bacterium]
QFAGNLSTASSIDLNVVQIVNQAPTVTMPSSINYLDDTKVLTFNGNMSIADVDGSNNIETVVINSSYGNLTLSTTNGLTTFSGNNSNLITITGKISQINAALNGLKYTPNSGYVGQDLITLKVNDNNDSSVNGALSAVGSVNIGVGLPEDIPSITLPSNVMFNVYSNNQYTFVNNAISVSSSLGNNNLYESVSLLSDNGTLTLGGVTGVNVSGNGTANISLWGTIANINNALNNLVYTRVNGYIDQLIVTVNEINSTNTVNTSPKIMNSIAINSSTTMLTGLNSVSPKV